MAYTVQNNMLIHQMDVVTAFLNGRLDEEIYKLQPDGYVAPGEQHLVCKLKKSIYGLKQSPRCWNQAFHEHLESIGFAQSGADPCVYIRVAEPMVTIAVYVDDLPLITKTERGDAKSEERPGNSVQDEGSRRTPLLSRSVCGVGQGSKVTLTQPD